MRSSAESVLVTQLLKGIRNPPTPLGRRPEVRLASASVPLCATLLNPANAAEPKTEDGGRETRSVALHRKKLNP